MQEPINHVVTLRLNCGVGPTRTFIQNIHVPIPAPHGFYVRSISYGNPAVAENMNYSIWTSLINNTIGTITPGQTATPNTYFSLHGMPPEGNFIFRIDDTATPSVTALNCFVIVLEFVRFPN